MRETKGIGGRIKTKPEDFLVEEIPKEGKTSGREHAIFWVEKVNLDTQDVVRILSRKLHVSRKRFGYAGTKDKFAVARQRFSVWDPDFSLEKKLGEIRAKRFRIYGIERGGRITLGDLKGNRFTVTIRDIDLEEGEIRKRLERIFEELKRGVPNFFGEQRFGGIRPVTHLVGLEMLRGNFENAVRIYVAKPFDREPEDVRKIREFLWENWGNRRCYLKGLREFPKRFRYERAMLDYLYKHPRDFVGALRRVPKRIRKLFVNAVQAKIFNRVLKLLLERKGVEGLKNAEIPLPGYDTVFGEREEERMVKESMERLGISRADFLLKSVPEMRTSGSRRKAVIEVGDVKLLRIGEDEVNKGRMLATVTFSLPPGSYATVVLEKIMKGEIDAFC